MFNINCDKFESICRAVETHALYGANIPMYFNKSGTHLTKDRVAAAFISDSPFGMDVNFDTTVIKAVNNYNSIKVFKSNVPLNYRALISFIYKLRIEGYVATSLANMTINNGDYIVYVDELHTETDIINVSVSDNFRDMVKFFIKEHSCKHKERHTSRIVKIYSDNNNDMFNIVKISLKKNFNELAEFIVSSENGEEYRIYEGTDIVCIMKDNALMFVTEKSNICLSSFLDSIEKESAYQGNICTINITNEILMF